MKRKLLIERDPVALVPWQKPEEVKKEAKVIIEGKISEALRKPLVVDPRFINVKLEGLTTRDIIVRSSPFLPRSLESHGLAPEFGEFISAVWSGYRSVIYCEDWAKAAQMFKLKGLSFTYPLGVKVDEDDDGCHVYVQGGQLKSNVFNEKEYSDKFNKALREHGVEPVSECVGFYEWPLRAKRKRIATSIMKVQGDTRLDELFTVIENLILKEFEVSKGHCEVSPTLLRNIKSFYSHAGYAFGQLKSLMDNNDQSWSDNPQRTNAHIGNAVLYYDSQGDFCLNLTDFDASCDPRDMKKSALRKQQEIEYQAILNSVMSRNISMREIGNDLNPEVVFRNLRESFVQGFTQGYAEFNNHRLLFANAGISNLLPEEILDDIFREILRGRPQAPIRYSGGSNELTTKIEDMYGYNQVYNTQISGLESLVKSYKSEDDGPIYGGNSTYYRIPDYTGSYKSSIYDTDDLSDEKRKYKSNYI